jgi:hypothetical protein
MPDAKLCQLVVLIIVAGCTTQPGRDHRADSANAAAADVQCHSDLLTGTMLSKTVCTTRAQRDAAQADAENIRKAAAQSNSCRSSSGAGCP